MSKATKKTGERRRNAASRRRQTFLLEVVRGGLVPADGYTRSQLRAKGYKVGDHLLSTLHKPRNPKFHRLAHRLGTLVAENIEEFSGMDAHAVLKRLQVEGNIACDEFPAFLDIMGQRIKIAHRMPRSLSFADMDEGEFRQTFTAMCNVIARDYWADCTADQIELMAAAMPEAA